MTDDQKEEKLYQNLLESHDAQSTFLNIERCLNRIHIAFFQLICELSKQDFDNECIQTSSILHQILIDELIIQSNRLNEKVKNKMKDKYEVVEREVKRYREYRDSRKEIHSPEVTE